MPEARDLEELNAYLRRCCEEDQRRTIWGRSQTMGEAMLSEQAHLLPLVPEPFDLTEASFATVDGLRRGCGTKASAWLGLDACTYVR